VILRGNEKGKEPWFPRPLIQEIELGIPVIGMEHEQGKREEAYVYSFHLILLFLSLSSCEIIYSQFTLLFL